MYKDFEVFGGAREFVNYRGPEAIIHGPAETGKAQPLTSVVWTPTGPCEMRDIAVGDEVLTPGGCRAQVRGIYPQGHQEVYRVTFSNGDMAECTADHLWLLHYMGGGKRNDNKLREMQCILPLREIFDNYRIGQKRPRPKYWIPQSLPVDFDERDVPIDPYVLGVLLGDGHLRKGSISISSADGEILERIAQGLGSNYELIQRGKYDYRIRANGFRPRRPSTGKPGHVHRNSNCSTWSATGRLPDAKGYKYLGSFKTKQEAQQAVDEYAPKAYSDDDILGVGLWSDIERLGLENARSRSKFIPELYKWNGVGVRLNVLRGLMDSDGTVDKRTGMPSYCTISKQLALDVKEILGSLGASAIIREKKKDGKFIAYDLTVQHNDNPELFLLQRKRDVTKLRTKYSVKRMLVNIEQVGRKECQCIKLDTEQGMYLTDCFVPTHNTIAALYKLHIAASTYQNASIVIVRKTLASTYSTVLQMFQNKVLYDGCGAVPYGGQKPEWFDYPATGGRIWLTGMDKSSKVLSAEHDIIYANQVEELTLDDWETLTTRTTGRAGNMPYSQTIGDCNPAWPTHWIYNRPSLKLFYSRHEENPVLFDQETGEITGQGRRTMAVLEALTGLRRIRLLDGKPAQAEGMIYTDWDEAVHLVDEAPRCRRHVAGVDWGYTHPGVIGVWGLDNDGAMYLVAQIYRTRQNSDWWTERAVELNAEFGVEAWTCDPSQPAYIAQFRAAGLNAVPAFTAVLPGIDAVQKRWTQHRLFIVRDNLRHPDQQLIANHQPYRMRDEIPGYVWANNKTKEQPVKTLDDGQDMARYSVAHVDGLGRHIGSMADVPQSDSQPSRWDVASQPERTSRKRSRWSVQ